jgi:hypothetical protein
LIVGIAFLDSAQKPLGNFGAPGSPGREGVPLLLMRAEKYKEYAADWQGLAVSHGFRDFRGGAQDFLTIREYAGCI